MYNIQVPVRCKQEFVFKQLDSIYIFVVYLCSGAGSVNN